MPRERPQTGNRGIIAIIAIVIVLVGVALIVSFTVPAPHLQQSSAAASAAITSVL